MKSVDSKDSISNALDSINLAASAGISYKETPSGSAPSESRHFRAEYPYRICNRCVMDTTDPEIEFDESGCCNHCARYERITSEQLYDSPDQQGKLDHLLAEIKRQGKSRKYDCVIGVSGGVDSTYVAYQVKRWGLRPLAVHLDNGWDSELAVNNIKKTLKVLGIELETYVIDWPEFRDLQLAFLKASTPDSEIPSDHAIVSLLFKTAAREGIKYILSGENLRTEAILPRQWSQGHSDWRYIKTLHRLYGTRRLKTYPHLSLAELGYLQYISGIRKLHVLNYIPYVKEEAMKQIQQDLGWISYGGKHYESIYTRFYQGYILPTKFNYDKRKAHLSALICSGQMSRVSGLKLLELPPYPDQNLLREDRLYVVKKLGITELEFQAILSSPPRKYDDFSNYQKHFLYKPAQSIYRWLKRSKILRSL